MESFGLPNKNPNLTWILKLNTFKDQRQDPKLNMLVETRDFTQSYLVKNGDNSDVEPVKFYLWMISDQQLNTSEDKSVYFFSSPTSEAKDLVIASLLLARS